MSDMSDDFTKVHERKKPKKKPIKATRPTDRSQQTIDGAAVTQKTLVELRQVHHAKVSK